MKKVLTLALGLAIVGGSMTSCKKGENDPFMSLKSRKARVAGEWVMSASESTRTTTQTFSGVSTTTTTTTVYDGTTETRTETVAGQTPTVTTSSYVQEMTFEKDGTFTQTYTSGGSTWTSKGNWAFLTKSKEAELKKKEAILLSVTSSTSTPGTATSTYGAFEDGQVLMIDQLKSKEMIILDNSSWSDTDTGSSNTSTTTGTSTMTAK